MPCIQIRTNVSVKNTQADELKHILGQGIGCLPGKSEDWLMVSIEDKCQMYFGGKNDGPIALTEVKIWGDSIDQNGARELTEIITKAMNDTLGVAPDHMYIKYEAFTDWAFNGRHL